MKQTEENKTKEGLIDVIIKDMEDNPEQWKVGIGWMPGFGGSVAISKNNISVARGSQFLVIHLNKTTGIVKLSRSNIAKIDKIIINNFAKWERRWNRKSEVEILREAKL